MELTLLHCFNLLACQSKYKCNILSFKEFSACLQIEEHHLILEWSDLKEALIMHLYDAIHRQYQIPHQYCSYGHTFCCQVNNNTFLYTHCSLCGHTFKYCLILTTLYTARLLNYKLPHWPHVSVNYTFFHMHTTRNYNPQPLHDSFSSNINK